MEKKTCMDDLDRIWEAINNFGFRKKGTLRRGFLAVLVSGKAKDEAAARRKAERKKKRIETMIDERFNGKEAVVKYEYSNISSEKENGGVLQWGVFCIQISLKIK